jgi:hypothetical protein
MLPDGDAKNCTFGVSHQEHVSAVARGAKIGAEKAIPVAAPISTVAAPTNGFINFLPFRGPPSKQAANDAMLTARSGL